jgi:CheY-like chemotaxis protein
MSSSVLVSLQVGARPLRILVVDDDAHTRQMLSEVLELFGARVRTAESVAAARRVLDEFTPDVVVSDVGMPQESGYDLIRQLRAMPREHGGGAPAIAFTGYARPEDRDRALDAGYQDVVPKPVDLERLLRAIARLSDAAVPRRRRNSDRRERPVPLR